MIIGQVNLIFVEKALNTLKKYCEDHPTCDGCIFNKKHIGCRFRGLTPREYKPLIDKCNDKMKE